jgi:hypothetical protein
LEDFISHDEIEFIRRHASFQELVNAVHLQDLFTLITMLFFRSQGALHDLTRMEEAQAGQPDDKSPNRELAERKELYKCMRRGAIACCEVLFRCASEAAWRDQHLAGLAKQWQARTLTLDDGSTDQARQLLEEALLDLTTVSALPDRHDALLDLARIMAESNPARATEYLRESAAIRLQLGVPEKQRSRTE